MLDTAPKLVETRDAPFQAKYDNFINGRFVAPTSGRYFENTSPVNGKVLCQIARSDAHDINAALDAAHAAKDAWGKTSATERAL
ncbi:MAG: aldehyde dehydrogenase family protein, partial [Pseudomonadota bacterium]